MNAFRVASFGDEVDPENWCVFDANNADVTSAVKDLAGQLKNDGMAGTAEQIIGIQNATRDLIRPDF